jgi:hypothetical protein
MIATGRTSCAGALALLITICHAATGRCADPDELTEKDILLVTHAVDFVDPPLARKWQHLSESGDKYNPTLLRIIDTTRSPCAVARVLTVFRQAKSQNPAVLPAIRRLIARNRAVENPGRNEEMSLLAAGAALGDLGRIEDTELLLDMLDDERPCPQLGAEFSRLTMIEALGKLGNRRTADRLEEVLGTMALKLTAEQIRKDESFRQGFRTAADIRYRSLLGQAGGSRHDGG